MADYAPLVDPNYLEPIYENKTRNRFPQASCDPGYNLPVDAFARLKPSYVAQPFLQYDADTGQLEERSAVKSTATDGASSSSCASVASIDVDDARRGFARSTRCCDGACTRGPYSAVVDAHAKRVNGARGAPNAASATNKPCPTGCCAGTPEADGGPTARDCAIAAMDAGEYPWMATSRATKDLYRTAGCEPCELVLSCGDCDGRYGESCQPMTAFKRMGRRRRKRYGVVGQNGPPALQMPGMDHMERTSDYAGGGDDVGVDNNYEYQSPRQFEAKTLTTNNWFLSRYQKMVFENEKERLRTQYGMTPPFPEPCPPTPIGVAPRYDPAPAEAQRAPPIVFDRQAFTANDSCGCNKSTCANDPSGSTCAPCFRRPQSVAGIYARQSK